MFAVRLWEVSVSNRQSLLDPFVWLASKMTQPQGTVLPLSADSAQLVLVLPVLSVKQSIELLMILHLRAAGCHVPYGITQGYLTQVNTPHFNPSQRPVLDLPTPEGWKAELTYVTGCIRKYPYRRSPI